MVTACMASTGGQKRACAPISGANWNSGGSCKNCSGARNFSPSQFFIACSTLVMSAGNLSHVIPTYHKLIAMTVSWNYKLNLLKIKNKKFIFTKASKTVFSHQIKLSWSIRRYQFNRSAYKRFWRSSRPMPPLSSLSFIGFWFLRRILVVFMP